MRPSGVRFGVGHSLTRRSSGTDNSVSSISTMWKVILSD